MRITRDFILKFASEDVARRAKANLDLMAAYLCGSFRGEEYLLGGAGDVDLVYVYGESPEVGREIVRLTDEVHLDIANHAQARYRDTRRLRVDPWLGPLMNDCKILHDPQHYLDFVQASVRGQFGRPDHVYQRARPLADRARELWFGLQGEAQAADPGSVRLYLDAVGAAANAIALLGGPPLPERRLLLEFGGRADQLARPGLLHGLLGLLGAGSLRSEDLPGWISAWEKAYRALPDRDRPVRFHPARLKYYLGPLTETGASQQPSALLWLLLDTWTELAGLFPPDSGDRLAWQQACERLGLYGAGLSRRVEALDAYLDTIDEVLETWARQNGV